MRMIPGCVFLLSATNAGDQQYYEIPRDLQKEPSHHHEVHMYIAVCFNIGLILFELQSWPNMNYFQICSSVIHVYLNVWYISLCIMIKIIWRGSHLRPQRVPTWEKHCSTLLDVPMLQLGPWLRCYRSLCTSALLSCTHWLHPSSSCQNSGEQEHGQWSLWKRNPLTNGVPF